MHFNTRAFENLGILILGHKPMQAMEIEQNIAEAMPAIEHQIFSFEDYEQALDHCKERKNVALIFMQEEETGLLRDKVKNLQAIYQNCGLPCGVVLYCHDRPCFESMRLMRDDKTVLTQITAVELLGPAIAQHMNEIWKLYIECVQTQILDNNTEMMLRQVVEQNNRAHELLFKEKVCRIVSNGLNLSWQDHLCLDLHFLIDEVAMYDANLLKGQSGAKQLSSQVIPPSNLAFVQMIKDKDISLACKLTYIVEELSIFQAQGKLQEKINEMCQYNRPGAPAIIKQLALKQDSILACEYDDEEQKWAI